MRARGRYAAPLHRAGLLSAVVTEGVVATWLSEPGLPFAFSGSTGPDPVCASLKFLVGCKASRAETSRTRDRLSFSTWSQVSQASLDSPRPTCVAGLELRELDRTGAHGAPDYLDGRRGAVASAHWLMSARKYGGRDSWGFASRPAKGPWRKWCSRGRMGGCAGCRPAE